MSKYCGLQRLQSQKNVEKVGILRRCFQSFFNVEKGSRFRRRKKRSELSFDVLLKLKTVGKHRKNRRQFVDALKKGPEKRSKNRHNSKVGLFLVVL